MKRLKAIDVGSAMSFGAFFFGLWTLVYGLYVWLLGWMFGTASWFVDMNLANWSEYTADTLFTVFLKALVSAVGGALTGLVVALVYNASSSAMGGLKVDLD